MRPLLSKTFDKIRNLEIHLKLLKAKGLRLGFFLIRLAAEGCDMEHAAVLWQEMIVVMVNPKHPRH